MERLLLILLSLAFVLLAVVIYFGKADWMLVNYKLKFKDRKPVFVAKKYNKERTRPLLALMMLIVSLMLLLNLFFPSCARYISAIVAVAVLLPFAIFVELRCREKEDGK